MYHFKSCHSQGQACVSAHVCLSLGQRTRFHWQSPSVQPVPCSLPMQALESPDQEGDILHPQLHWACAPSSGQRVRMQGNRLSLYKYIYRHMHTSYTYTDLFSSLESTNQRIKDPLLSKVCYLLESCLFWYRNNKTGTHPWTQTCGLIPTLCAAVAAQLTQQILLECWGSQGLSSLLCCYFTPWNNLMPPDTRNKRWGQHCIW